MEKLGNIIAITYLDKPVECGDFVEYIDTKSVTVKGKRIAAKVSCFGLWDGEFVECCDKERTTVRNLKWIRPVKLHLARYLLVEDIK